MSMNSPVGLGLVFPGDQMAPGGLSPSTQGLIIDGGDPASGGPTAGGTQVFAGTFWASRVLTVAQCRALNTTPQALVIGTPNSTIIPIAFFARVINPSLTPFNVTVNVGLRYTGVPGLQPMQISALFSASGATSWMQYAPLTNTQWFSGSGADVRGLTLNIYGNQDCTGGNANLFAQFWCLYTRLLSTQ